MPIAKLMLAPFAIITLLLSLSVQAEETDNFCIPPDRIGGLINQMKISHPKLNQDSFLTSITMTKMSSANVGKNLYNQVLEITLTDDKGQEFIAISQHKTATEECKMLSTELQPFIGPRNQ